MSSRRDLIAGLLGAAGAAAVSKVPGQAPAAPALSDADVERIADVVEARLEAKQGEEHWLTSLQKLTQEGWLSREDVLKLMNSPIILEQPSYQPPPPELKLPQSPFWQIKLNGETYQVPNMLSGSGVTINTASGIISATMASW